MKISTRAVWATGALLLVGTVAAASPAMQPSVPVVPVGPGSTISITCSTTLHIIPQSPGEVLASCEALPSATSTPTSTPTATALTTTPTGTSVPASPTTPPPPSGDGLWISPAELAALPTSGSAWTNMVSVANGSWGTPKLADNNSNHDVMTLTGALVAARTNNASLKAKVADAILSARETENTGRSLEISRNLVSYVIAADVIDLKTFDPAKDGLFRTWLDGVRREVLDGKSIISTQEERPNNWGTMASASRIAAARYLGDAQDLARAAVVFHGWLGDRASYADFDYGELDWQCNPSALVGINPVGCTKDGHNIDGVLPDDQRRTGGWTWPAPKGSYPHEALQGALVAAQLLSRAGYPAWEWENQALRRAYVWLYSVNNNPPSGDDSSYPFLVNRAYGTNFAPGSTPNGTGKNMCCLSWTHGS